MNISGHTDGGYKIFWSYRWGVQDFLVIQMGSTRFSGHTDGEYKIFQGKQIKVDPKYIKRH